MEEAAGKRVEIDRESLEKRPGIFFIGSPNVGKRTILSREFYHVLKYMYSCVCWLFY